MKKIQWGLGLAILAALVVAPAFFAGAAAGTERGMRAEYPVLILFSSVGMGLMVSANDFMTLYLGLELTSLTSYVLAKMKVRMGGKHPWARFIGSTFVGQGVDSLIFYPLAFIGIWSPQTLVAVMFANWVFKVLVEVVMTPVTTIVCAKLKQAEGVDAFDTDTDFTPFSLKR